MNGFNSVSISYDWRCPNHLFLCHLKYMSLCTIYSSFHLLRNSFFLYLFLFLIEKMFVMFLVIVMIGKFGRLWEKLRLILNIAQFGRGSSNTCKNSVRYEWRVMLCFFFWEGVLVRIIKFYIFNLILFNLIISSVCFFSLTVIYLFLQFFFILILC